MALWQSPSDNAMAEIEATLEDNRCKGGTECEGMCRDTWEPLGKKDNLVWAKLLGVVFIIWAILLLVPVALKAFGFLQ